MKLVLAVLLGVAACAIAYPQRESYKFRQSNYNQRSQQNDYPDSANAEDDGDYDFNSVNSMDDDDQPKEGKSFEDINFVEKMDHYNAEDGSDNDVNSMDDYDQADDFNRVRNMDDYDQPDGVKSMDDYQPDSNQVRNMDDYDQPDGVKSMDDYGQPDDFNHVKNMDDYDQPEDFKQVKNMDDYDQPADSNQVKNMDDYDQPDDFNQVRNMDDSDGDDAQSMDDYQNQFQDAEDFKQQRTRSEDEEEQAAMQEYNRLRNHEIKHEFGEKYNSEDYSNKMRGMEDDFENAKESQDDNDYDVQSEDDYPYKLKQGSRFQQYDGGDDNLKYAKYQGEGDNGDDDDGDDDLKYKLKQGSRYQQYDGGDDNLKYAKYQGEGDDGDDDGGDDDLKYMKYGRYRGEDGGDYRDKYASKYQSKQRYNDRYNSQKYGGAQAGTEGGYDPAKSYRYSKRDVMSKEESPCKCSSSERSLFAIKDPQEYWFKKIPSGLNMPTLTFNLTGVPANAKEILIHAMVHSGWLDKGNKYVGQVVLTTISKGTKSFQEGVPFYPFAKDEVNSYSTAHVSLPVTDERRVHVTVSPPAPKGKLHNISLKIKVVAYRV